MNGQLTFDVLLNSSVRPEDEVRLSRQAQAVLRLFVEADGAEVANTSLMRIAAQYNARLYEVRRHLVRQGYCVDLVRRVRDTGVNYYQMVPLASSTFYAKHKEKLER